MTNETKELIKSYLEDSISDNMGKELRPYILDKSYMYLDYNQKTNTLVFDKESKVKPISTDSRENFYKYWDENFTDKLVITHKNCNDGTGTAEVIKYYNKNKTLLLIEYMKLFSLLLSFFLLYTKKWLLLFDYNKPQV